ncbi:MAG: hypothetical protein ACRBBR_06035 [Cellvibrionaceae bacterium]
MRKTNMKNSLTLTLINVDTNGVSIFSEKTVGLSARGGMNISDQLPTLSCRLRTSAANYSSDWHVAGDPTLILIQQGKLRIYLQDNSYKDFGSGDYFVAQDALADDVIFDPKRHGHRAEVLGEQALQAVHVKLAKRIY